MLITSKEWLTQWLARKSSFLIPHFSFLITSIF